MSRYIDADAAIQWVEENECYTDKFKRIMEGVIDKQPTVDAVPVVRCKDCIEYRDSVGACHYFNYDPTDEMDFCSHGIRADGERRSDEDQHIYD